MKPLRVQAHLAGALSLPGGPLALDALLAAMVALREGLPPASVKGAVAIDVPLQREPKGRFHLASFAEYQWEAHELRWVNRRFPLEQAQPLGDSKLRRVLLSGGPCKSYRIPLEAGHVRGDTLTWWCVGEQEEMEALLALCTHLGKRRAVGNGKVLEWKVEPCEPWDHGFPVARGGLPLRNLPPDWLGLTPHAERGYAVLTYPYWERYREEECFVPSRT